MEPPFNRLPRSCGPALICLLALICAGPCAGGSQADASSEAPKTACVILLHGLARTSRSMNKMAAALDQAGYRTINLDYPSRKASIESLAMRFIPDALQQCSLATCETIHFVTHSMGGILLRHYLSRQPIERLGRVVMLSPPNGGSEVVDALKDNWFFRWYNGPAGQQLDTGPDGIAARLGPVDYPVGVITGNVHAFFDTHFSEIIPGADDGKVSVKRAAVKGMRDMLVLPYAHPFILGEREVILQTMHFLSRGTFLRPQGLENSE